MPKNSEMPSPRSMFLEIPLYSAYSINDVNYKDAIGIEFFIGTLDAFCIECRKESIFNRTPAIQLPLVGPSVHSVPAKTMEELLTYEHAMFLNGNSYERESLRAHAGKDKLFAIAFACMREAAHTLYFFFAVNNSTLMKIGQYPSLADLQRDTLKKYRKILGEQQYSEFNRAVGLSSHGIGIGAFVYLRRIFENLIEESHTKAVHIDGWNDEKFTQSRMDEKILLLQEYLPSFLVENRSLYSILSKGIHSLTEEECLELFEPVKLGIELILDEKIDQEEKADKISRTSKLLESIKSRLQQ